MEFTSPLIHCMDYTSPSCLHQKQLSAPLFQQLEGEKPELITKLLSICPRNVTMSWGLKKGKEKMTYLGSSFIN
jgi:hypothetical protein